MATPQQNIERFQAIADRGLQDRLEPDKRARFDEAVSRGLIRTSNDTDVSDTINQELSRLNQEAANNPPLLDRIVGGVPTAALSIAGDVIGGVSGLGAALFKGAEKGNEVLETVQDKALSLAPREGIQGVQDFAALPPVAALANLQQTLEQGAGDAGNAVAGPVGGAIGTAAPTLVESALGLRAGRSVVNAAERAGEAIPEVVSQFPEVVGKAAEAVSRTPDTIKQVLPSRRQALQGFQSGDVASTAGFQLNDAGQAVRNTAETRAIQAELPDSVIAVSRSASDESVLQIRRMLDIADTTIRSGRSGGNRLPSDVVGARVADRIRFVLQENRKAGKAIEAAAQGLRGKSIDVSAPVDAFVKNLTDRDIGFNPETGRLDFSGSDFEGLGQAQAPLQRLVNRMLNTQEPNALAVHRLKRYIDNNVTYGDGPKGLTGDAARILKELRHDLDDILDSNFPEYDQANTLYRETRQAIDGIQESAGKRVNLLSDSGSQKLGQLTRRLFGNTASRAALLDNLKRLDDTAKKLAGGPLPVPLKDAGKNVSFNDSLIDLAETAMDIELSVVDPKKSAFKGLITSAIESSPSIGIVTEVAKEAAKTVAKGKVTEASRRTRVKEQLDKLEAYRGLFDG